MGNLFGKKKTSKNQVNQHDKAVLDLKVQRDKLKQYQKKCEGVILRETEIAKQLSKEGKKKQALLALKKKRYQEQLLEKAAGQLENVSQMIDSIEFAQIEQKVFQGLQQGNEVLKDLHGQMSIEDVENLMLDTQEAIEYQNQIDELLGGVLTSEDEDAVNEELAALEAEVLQMPDVPSDKLPEVASGEKQPTKAKDKQPKEAVLA